MLCSQKLYQNISIFVKLQNKAGKPGFENMFLGFDLEDLWPCLEQWTPLALASSMLSSNPSLLITGTASCYWLTEIISISLVEIITQIKYELNQWIIIIIYYACHVHQSINPYCTVSALKLLKYWMSSVHPIAHNPILTHLTTAAISESVIMYTVHPIAHNPILTHLTTAAISESALLMCTLCSHYYCY